MQHTNLVAYIEGLTIGQGRYAGQHVRLFPWEKRFLKGAFSQPDDAGCSVARGNGKTTLVSAIMASTVDVDGPLVQPMAESLLVASSFDQALINFRHILHFLKPSFEKYGTSSRGRFRVQDSANRATVADRETGAMLRVLGSDPRRLHGAAPALLCLDEIAQWPHTQVDAMLAALTTSRGKIPNSRALWIGTRPKSETHPFAKALAGGLGYAQVHAAKPEDPKFQRRTWLTANPSLPWLPDLEATIRREAEQAKRDAALLASFGALRLNLGTSDVVEAVLLDAATWRRIEGEAETDGSYVLGCDMGGASAMTAFAAYHPASFRLDAIAAFPSEPSLEERGLRDGVGRSYVEMAKRGELVQLGKHTVDMGAFLALALERWGRPRWIVADRYAEDRLREALDACKFPPAALEPRGMGFRDGAEDVDRFRRAVLRGEVRPPVSLLLRSAMAEARTVADPAGNEKLAKATQGGRRLRARDDACAAAILAVAEGTRRRKQPRRGWRYRGSA